jgi:hypothetical protein
MQHDGRHDVCCVPQLIAPEARAPGPDGTCVLSTYQNHRHYYFLTAFRATMSPGSTRDFVISQQGEFGWLRRWSYCTSMIRLTL